MDAFMADFLTSQYLVAGYPVNTLGHWLFRISARRPMKTRSKFLKSLYSDHHCTLYIKVYTTCSEQTGAKVYTVTTCSELTEAVMGRWLYWYISPPTATGAVIILGHWFSRVFAAAASARALTSEKCFILICFQTTYQDTLGGCERIKKTPIPVAFVVCVCLCMCCDVCVCVWSSSTIPIYTYHLYK